MVGRLRTFWGDHRKFAKVKIYVIYAVFVFCVLGTKTNFLDRACGTVEAIFASNCWQWTIVDQIEKTSLADCIIGTGRHTLLQIIHYVRH